MANKGDVVKLATIPLNMKGNDVYLAAIFQLWFSLLICWSANQTNSEHTFAIRFVITEYKYCVYQVKIRVNIVLCWCWVKIRECIGLFWPKDTVFKLKIICGSVRTQYEDDHMESLPNKERGWRSYSRLVNDNQSYFLCPVSV